MIGAAGTHPPPVGDKAGACEVEIWAVPPAETEAALLAVLSARRGHPVAAADLVRGTKGKPDLPGEPPIGFNVTHCRDLGLVAVAAVPLGIDVERAERVLDADRLARRILADGEAAAYAVLDGAEARRRFMLRRWVRKEAVVKALGHGLTVPLRGFDVGRDSGLAVPLGAGGHVPWHLVDLDLPGHVAALAALGARPRPRLRPAGDFTRIPDGAAASSDGVGPAGGGPMRRARDPGEGE